MLAQYHYDYDFEHAFSHELIVARSRALRGQYHVVPLILFACPGHDVRSSHSNWSLRAFANQI